MACGKRDGETAMRKFQGLGHVDLPSKSNDQTGDHQPKSEDDKKGDLFQ